MGQQKRVTLGGGECLEQCLMGTFKLSVSSALSKKTIYECHKQFSKVLAGTLSAQRCLKVLLVRKSAQEGTCWYLGAMSIAQGTFFSVQPRNEGFQNTSSADFSGLYNSL